MTYQRKTRDEFQVQGNYGYGHGWETENTEATRKEARQSLREYRDNGPGQYRLVCKRIRIEGARA